MCLLLAELPNTQVYKLYEPGSVPRRACFFLHTQLYSSHIHHSAAATATHSAAEDPNAAGCCW